MTAKNVKKNATIILSLLVISLEANGASISSKSYHLGIMHPNGVDIVGYTVEIPQTRNVYRYYNFGFPSLAAVGISYYENYNGNGLTSTLGIGVGSVLYGSIAYQFSIENIQYLKIGAGFTASIIYSGVYPVLAYEYRF